MEVDAMADEKTPLVEGEQEQVQPDVTDLLARLEALAVSQAALQEQIVTQAAPPEAETVPPPAPPPEPTGGRITREQYTAMSTYAAAQAQDAEKYRLAAQHGLQPEDLVGEFASPQAMQQYAELLSLRQDVQTLGQSLQASLEPPPPPEPEGEEEEPPPGDLGGPTGTQSPEQGATVARYEAARALGRTVEGRQAMLQAIYGDPDKMSLVRER
jgi:hypothetical protein